MARNYNVIMKTKLVQIGNSRGIRIPKVLIEQAGLNGSVDMELRGAELVLRATSKKKPSDPRAGWDEAFERAIAKHGLPEIDHEWLDAPLVDDADLPPW